MLTNIPASLAEKTHVLARKKNQYRRCVKHSCAYVFMAESMPLRLSRFSGGGGYSPSRTNRHISRNPTPYATPPMMKIIRKCSSECLKTHLLYAIPASENTIRNRAKNRERNFVGTMSLNR